MQVAAAVRTADGDEVLLTHAGLTVGAWRHLGEPMTATTAALRLNERPEPLIWLGDGFTTDTVATDVGGGRPRAVRAVDALLWRRRLRALRSGARPLVSRQLPRSDVAVHRTGTSARHG